MSKYSLIPATISTSIISGSCHISDDNTIDLSFSTYAPPPDRCVYKACLGRINSIDSPTNLGTIRMSHVHGRLTAKVPEITSDMSVIIYIKDTISLDTTPEGYFLICDKDIDNIEIMRNASKEFYIKCDFAEDTPKEANDEYSAITNAEDTLKEYMKMHPPSDASKCINKLYINKIKEKLSSYKRFNEFDHQFDWYIIDTFDTIANLSAVKYVLFDTLSINAFDTHKHYLFGVKNEINDESYYIAIALPSKANPINHLNDFANIIPYSESYDYFVAYIELAPDGQYFLSADEVLDFEGN